MIHNLSKMGLARTARITSALGVTSEELERRFPLAIGTCVWCWANGIVRVNGRDSFCEPCFADGVELFIAAALQGRVCCGEVN